MAIINSVNEVLHRIRVKLYPNYLPKAGGAYVARTNNEASLSIEQVCAAMKNRGGFSGNYDNLVEYVRQFFDEAAYQLCDGYAVNTGYFSINPNICGTFNTVNETYDRKKNPITFRFRTLIKLRRLAEHITVDIEGLANGQGNIDKFTDLDKDSVNKLYVPGNQFSISGQKIKVAGDDPGCGVFFVPVDDPSKAVKVTRLAENGSARIIGIAPKTKSRHNKIEIRTQYTGSAATYLKKPRIIASGFVLEEAS